MIKQIFSEKFFVHAVIPPEREMHALFPLKAIGYLESAVHKELVYSDMLEISLRLSSDEPYAVDILDGVRYETPFPHVILKKTGVHHDYQTKIPRKSFFLQYRPETVQEMEHAGISFDPLIWRFPLTDRVLNGINSLLEISPLLHLPLMREKADALAWSLLLELFEHRSCPMRDDEIFSKLQSISFYLMMHYLDPPDISELAMRYGLSERSLFRHWRKYYTESPLEMIQRLKLDHAKNCLRHTNMTVEEIATVLHCNTIYFHRFFRNKMGCTPLQYRKNG